MTKKDKQRSNEHIHKIKGRVTRTPLKLGVNSGAPEGKAVPTKYAFVSEKHNYQYLILVPLILGVCNRDCVSQFSRIQLRLINGY